MLQESELQQEVRYNPHAHRCHGGLVLSLRAVPDILVQRYVMQAEQQARREGLMIDPPKYRVYLGDAKFYEARGVERPFEEVSHVYDPERGINTLDVEDAETTRDNWARWRQYQADLAKVNAIKEERSVLALYVFGIDLEGTEPPALQSPEWRRVEAVLEVLGLSMPQNAMERTTFWLLYGGLMDSMDLQMVRAKIQFISVESTIDPDEVRSFLRNVTAGMEQRSRDAMARATAAIKQGLEGEPGVQ